MRLKKIFTSLYIVKFKNLKSEAYTLRDGLLKFVQIHKGGSSFLGPTLIKIKHKKVIWVMIFGQILNCNFVVGNRIKTSDFL